MTDLVTIELDHVERDLLLCALECWRHRLTKSEECRTTGHRYAKQFTVRRINELYARLEEAGAPPVDDGGKQG